MKNYVGIIVHQRLTVSKQRPETNGIAERAVRRMKEGTSAVLFQSGLDEKVVGGFHGMFLFSAICSRPPIRWENTFCTDLGAPDDFWSIEGNLVHRHHVELEVNLFVPKENVIPSTIAIY